MRSSPAWPVSPQSQPPRASELATASTAAATGINCALHRIAVTQGRVHPPAQAFLARKQAEGKTRIEALRCQKRHLARRVWRLLVSSEIDISMTTVDSQRDVLAPQIAAVA
jgi:hypothetical protein